MKIKTSITLPQALLREIDRRRDAQGRSRSAFIEEAVRAFLAGADRAALQVREAALLRKHAAPLNAEMADVLDIPDPVVRRGDVSRVAHPARTDGTRFRVSVADAGSHGHRRGQGARVRYAGSAPCGDAFCVVRGVYFLVGQPMGYPDWLVENVGGSQKGSAASVRCA